MLTSKDIKHESLTYGRAIVDTYTAPNGWRLKVQTRHAGGVYSTVISEVTSDGTMEYPAPNGINKQVYSIKGARYSDKALRGAHKSGEVLAMVAYGEHIGAR
jgi:hypothetical protein